VTEPRKPGRPRAGAAKRKPVGVYLTEAVIAEVDTRRAQLGLDRSRYLERLILASLHSTEQRAWEYHESGQAAIDEADDIAEQMAALEQDIARLNPPT
jgi:hypothetical protein